MNNELKSKLVERAKQMSVRAHTKETKIGCSLLTDDNLIFGGCNIQIGERHICAGEVTITKAMSEGYIKFVAICLWSKDAQPYLSTNAHKLLEVICPDIEIILTTNKDT